MSDPRQYFANNASTTLAAPILTGGAISMTVASAAGFPSPPLNSWFIGTLLHLVGGVVTAREVVKVTHVVGAVMAIVRGQEGTAPLTWAIGDTFALLPTAGGLANFAQPLDTQSQVGNFAPDTGTGPDNYDVNIPPTYPFSNRVGMPIRTLIAHTNTGPCTLSASAVTGSIVTPDGAPLTANTLLAGGIYEFIWNGSAFQLISRS
jgi:hypothetical protein